MKKSSYTKRYKELEHVFSMEHDCLLDDTSIAVKLCAFQSNYECELSECDKEIDENIAFKYPVFVPKGMATAKHAILFLHGLNERRWNKYLTWAEYLCKATGKPIILFPIAFHINRSPSSWSNPREMLHLLNLRKTKNGSDRYLTFANAALSERISNEPLRFYKSGRQSVLDVNFLIRNLKEGRHLLFKENTEVDIFAYSIGAFLSQILLMNNAGNMYSGSKLFMFCGGSIFNAMFGKSRSILDEAAFDTLLNYYMNDFAKDAQAEISKDKMLKCFYSMIDHERNKQERENIFSGMGNRISGISLKKDIVIPYEGIKKAMGKTYTESHIGYTDFDFDYSHESPFPVAGKVNSNLVDKAFDSVFKSAAAFFS